MPGKEGYRSEANRFSNKKNYKKYNLTRYPNDLDTRTNNTNMRGFINIGETAGIPDYVMAEYVNAAMDSIMALQQSLGEEPMVYHGATESQVNNLIETFSVSERITRIENGLFDERYGGKGWTYVNSRPVLNNHKHDGLNGHPPKIKLTEDVDGLLPHQNINLNYQTGLTGSQISISNQDSTKIADSLDDLLSKSEGGTVTGNVMFTGVVKTRISMDATAVDIKNKGQSTLISDNEATSSRALSTTNTTSLRTLFTIEAEEKEHLLYGRYILGVRIKKNNNSNENTNVIEFDLNGQREAIQGGDIQSSYRTIHYVFEHNRSNVNNSLTLSKLFSSSAQEIRVDSYYVTPIHPATLDR